MNREKLQEIRSRTYQEARHTVRDVIDALLEDDEPPRIDRSLRGPVEVTTEDGTSLLYADIWGLFVYADMADVTGNCSWGDAEARGWTVRPLTPEDIGFKVRRWDELEIKERREFRDQAYADLTTWEKEFDLAIDIATRRTP